MFSFTQHPMTTIDLGDVETSVDLSFNRVIAAYEVFDSDIEQEDKINQVFELFVDPNLTRSVSFRSEIVGAIFMYINDKPYGNDAGGMDALDPAFKPQADFDFEQDAAAIYASFMFDYQMDLNEMRDKLHWDVFKALFDNLSSKTALNRIRGHRNENVADYSDDAKRTAEVVELQSYYQLDKYKGDQANAQDVGFNMMAGMFANAETLEE